MKVTEKISEHAQIPHQPMDQADVTILGGSICGLMTACHLKQQMPDLEVLVVGPKPCQEKRPIVGESLLEPATYFFHRIGMEDYLEREQAIKCGLSFYYKLSPDDPVDRRYTVHSPELLHKFSRQLHRPRFDEDMRQHAIGLGVRFLEGVAKEIELGSGGTDHKLRLRLTDDDVGLKTRWVIDATGRSRWLGKQVTDYDRPKERQRSSFWFRLANFKPFSQEIECSMRRPLKYDLWNTTHHFMGRGYFVWVIPLKSAEYDNILSIGITFRPDLFDRRMNSVEEFLDFMDQEHPALADMVRSGMVLDKQTYGNFLYATNHFYSPDGWFLVGDAVRAVDPLYSTGLSLTVPQIEQIGEIISRQRGPGITDQEIKVFEELWDTVAEARQEEITSLYDHMHDPFQACMRRYWNNISWFNLILPLWWNGLFHDLEAARILLTLFKQGKPLQDSANRLFGQVAKKLGTQLSQADYDRAVDFDFLLNPAWDCTRGEVPYQFSRVFYKRAAHRWKLLQMTHYRYMLGQLPSLTVEMIMYRLLPVILRWRAPHAFPKLKKSKRTSESHHVSITGEVSS
jgi:flavin-dependent dehydrogenase